MPWIRNRLWWSIRPYAAGRRTTARHCGPERSCRTRRTSTARPAVAVPRAGRPTPPITGAARARRGTPRGDALRGRALHPPPGAGRRARNARRSRVTPAPPDAPPTGAVCGDGVAAVDDLYDCAAGGRLSGASVCGDNEEADQCVEAAAPRARRVERVGSNVWRRHAAPRSPAGRGTGRAGVRGAGVPVSSSSRGPSCVTRAPRPTVGLQRRDHSSAGHRRVRVRHAAILRHRDGYFHWDGYRHCDGRLHCDGHLHWDGSLHSGGWPRSGEWRLGWASLSRLSRRGSARRGVPAGRVATRSVSRPSGAPGVRPAASGPSVSRSSSCACAPCGDPLDIGRVTYIWIVAYVTYDWIVTYVWRVASRLGESVAEGIRLPRGDRALRDPPASRARASVPASRASGRRTGAARVSLGGEWSPAPRRRRGWRRAPAPP